MEIAKFDTCPGTSKCPLCTCPNKILLFENSMKPVYSFENSVDPDQLDQDLAKPSSLADLQMRVCIWKLVFFFLNQNVCCRCSKEPSQWDGSFEHPKHMLFLGGKKIFIIWRLKCLPIWTYGLVWGLAWYSCSCYLVCSHFETDVDYFMQ